MSLSPIVKLLFAVFILSQLACKCDGRVDCERPYHFAEIRLVRDGKNAVFGPDAFIDRDSILILSPDPRYLNFKVTFIDSTESMIINIFPNFPIILETPGHLDTLTCTTIITDRSECCVQYSLSSIQWNGEDICSENCADILDIQI
ncbi:MAG: hypothetical protein KA166_00975 [Saprospiraceae bacterium]|nr:hypothetical protein [Candidatus Opimibacter skivensis]MBP6679731.1 hypothetical protein [Saprospiraceae bacterium]